MNQQAAPIIQFEGVNKWYASNGYHVLRDVNLSFAKGEKVVICGPSGSGKPTCLRGLAGLERGARGTVRVDGTDVTGVPLETYTHDDIVGLAKVFTGWTFNGVKAWNAPMMTVLQKLGPALLAGCTAVLKPASLATLRRNQRVVERLATAQPDNPVWKRWIYLTQGRLADALDG